MNINQARTLANIAARAESITEDYRIVWNRFEEAFYVAHKTDRKRRYLVTIGCCSCPSFTHYGTCKHHIGLPALLVIEIARYMLLGFTDDRDRMEYLLFEVEAAMLWNNTQEVDRMAEEYETGRYY